MKKVNYSIIHSPNKDGVSIKDKQYSIFLRRGLTIYISNFKAARTFLNKTNEFYTERLAELNLLHTTLYVEYRNNWQILNPDQSRKINKDFYDVLDYFERIPSYKGINSHYYIFRDFDHLIDHLIKTCENLREIYESKNRYDCSMRIRVVAKHFNKIKDEIDIWGTDKSYVKRKAKKILF
jgi:hypothetical protein